MKNMPITVYLPPPLITMLKAMAKERGTTVSGTLRQALSIMHALELDTKAGRFVGATRNREALDTVIIAPL